MRLALSIISLLISSYANAQKISLEDVAKTVVKAFNKSDTSVLKSVVLTYEEYVFLDNEYLLTIDSGSKRQLYASERWNKRKYDSTMSHRLYREFDWDIDFRTRNKNRGSKLKYTNFGYSISLGPNRLVPEAYLYIFTQQDSIITVFQQIFCYEVNGKWKIYKYKNLNYYDATGKDAKSHLIQWQKHFANKKIEVIPDKVIETLWQQLLDDTIKLNPTLFLTNKEYTARLSDTLSSDVIEKSYDFYLSLLKKSIHIIHDSITKTQCIKRGLDKNQIPILIANSPLSGYEPWLRISLNFSPRCPGPLGGKQFAIGPFTLVKTFKNEWKLYNAYFFTESEQLYKDRPVHGAYSH